MEQTQYVFQTITLLYIVIKLNVQNTNEHNNQFPKQGYTQSHYRESENVKPIFLKDEDVFGSHKPERSLWLTNV